MTHREKAKELFCKGYNCSQAVFAAFCDVTKMDEATALRLSSSFGAGMGRLREVCGACSAIFMVAGMLYGNDEASPDKKKEHYARVQALAARFRDAHGTIICRELLSSLAAGRDTSPTPEERNEEYYKVRPCMRFVISASDILDEYIAENGAGKSENAVPALTD